MNRLVIASSLFALVCSAAPEALAQRAPVSRGATSTDLATNVADLRQQNAQLNLDITRLESEVAELNGQVETLEFLLSQSRDEMNRLQGDDARIGDELERLSEQNINLKSRLGELEAQMTAVVEAAQNRPAQMEPGADMAAMGEESETASRPSSRQDAQTSGSPRRIVARGDEAGDPGANPDYQGSLGSLQASDLPGEAGPLFAMAKSRLLKFDYEGAEEAFRAFLARFSDDPQAGEAQYWLAETLFQQEAYAESGQAYTQMIREYPDDARAPDALVKLARSMRLVGDTEKACNALALLPKQYPDASGVTRNLAALERTRAGCDA